MTPSLPSADAYMNDAVSYPPLTIVDIGRGTVNLCFEDLGAATVFVDRAT